LNKFLSSNLYSKETFCLDFPRGPIDLGKLTEFFPRAFQVNSIMANRISLFPSLPVSLPV
jgi:hypothetical protein